MITPVNSPAVLSARFEFERNQAGLSGVFQRLATGKKINSAKDDPAALIASEQLAAELAALQAESNTLRRVDANANITDGYAGQVSTLVADLNGLVVAGSNQAGMSDAERDAYQLQIDSTVDSIQRFTNEAVTSLEGVNLPNGGNAQVESALSGAAAAVCSVASGGPNNLASGFAEAAQAAIKDALSKSTTARGVVGAYQKNTLGPLQAALDVALENVAESKSQIADADYAVETSNLARGRMLSASSLLVLKTAQHEGQRVLSLLS